jgi:hypothetical protein
MFPKKEGKARAFKVLEKTIKNDEQYKNLCIAVSNYAEECVITKRERKFIKMFSSFIGPENAPFWPDYINWAKENALPFEKVKPEVFRP